MERRTCSGATSHVQRRVSKKEKIFARVLAGALSVVLLCALTLHRLLSANNDFFSHRQQQPHSEDRRKSLFERGEDDYYRNYRSVRSAFESRYAPNDDTRVLDYVTSIRRPLNPEVALSSYDVNDCPETPPDGYPMDFLLLDVLENWNPDDESSVSSHSVYQGVCRFNAQLPSHMARALTYRRAEVPFVLRDDISVLHTVERWNRDTDYLPSILQQRPQKTEYSANNHLMFYRVGNTHHLPTDWTPPIQQLSISYSSWLQKALQPPPPSLNDNSSNEYPHYYFRLNAKQHSAATAESALTRILYEELPFFRSPSPYIVDETDTRGINCRFGMPGNIAESHFDSSRNFIVLLGGERRYILNHPRDCQNLVLWEKGHPSARHSKLDWSSLSSSRKNEMFQRARGNEVVLQAGDILYLPTNWFHYIISLNGDNDNNTTTERIVGGKGSAINWQCNARSGRTDHYDDEIRNCGF